MNLLASIPFLRIKQDPPKQIVSNNWQDRNRILSHDVNMFCWQRSFNESIAQYLGNILSFDQPAIKYSINQDNLVKILTQARNDWKGGEDQTGYLFWRDLEEITIDFLQFSTRKAGVFHLKIITNNACTKFHIDGYDLRLFTTYYGPGTEWVPEEAVNRSALGTSNEQIIKDPSKVRRIGTGDVAILKGETPGQKRNTRGLVHRSPEIISENGKRVILRIDI